MTDQTITLIQQLTRRGYCAERRGSRAWAYVAGRWHAVRDLNHFFAIVAVSCYDR